MRFFFADDTVQNKPTRDGMGPLLGIGGFVVPGDKLRSLETELGKCCADAGLPNGEEVKWSPGRELWMHKNLTGDHRLGLYERMLAAAGNHSCTAFVVVVDTTAKPATRAAQPLDDAIHLFVERVGRELIKQRDDGVLVVDRPGGNRSQEDRFLERCLVLLEEGTAWVKPDRIAVNVLASPSHCIRALQLADVIAGCCTALVSGESRYAPAVFERIKPLLARSEGRIGGTGMKLHPHYKYANLYHWLCGDRHFLRMNGKLPLPLSGRAYGEGPDEAWPKILVDGQWV